MEQKGSNVIDSACERRKRGWSQTGKAEGRANITLKEKNHSTGGFE